MKNKIYSEWDGECYFSFGNSNSRGVCILFRKNLPITVNKIENDSIGNYLLLNLTYMTNIFTLCTLYGPNKDTPKFYTDPFKRITDFQTDEYIICGDFNCVLDVNLDYLNYTSINNNKNARQTL